MRIPHDLQQTLETKVNLIDRCFRVVRCQCCITGLPESERNFQSSSLIKKCESTSGIFPVVDSFLLSRPNGHQCNSHAQIVPIFEVIDAPRIQPIPSSSYISYDRLTTFHWAISVILQPSNSSRVNGKSICLSMEPYGGREVDVCTSWFTPTVVLTPEEIDRRKSVNLIAFTTHDFLIDGMQSEKNFHVQVSILSGQGDPFFFTVFQPVTLSLKTLLYRVCFHAQLVVEPVCSTVASQLSFIYPHSAVWHVRPASGSCRVTENEVLSHLFELLASRLYLPEAAFRKSNWYPLFWITCGPFAGLSVNAYISKVTSSCVLKVRSSSQSLLGLFRNAVISLSSEIELEPVDPIHRNWPQLFVDPTSVRFSQLIDCLLNEVQCLRSQLSHLVHTTMRERVPQLDMFLHLQTSGGLELAHRVSEWRDLVVNAPLLPVQPPGLCDSYLHCSRSTNWALERLCCGQQSELGSLFIQ